MLEPRKDEPEEETTGIREQIIEGCREMWDDLLEMEREFHPLEEEVERKYPDGFEWATDDR